jgi:maltose O-acetyltransferase
MSARTRAEGCPVSEPSATKAKRLRWILVTGVAPSAFTPRGLRMQILRRAGYELGAGTWFMSKFHIEPQELVTGERCYWNVGVHVTGFGRVEIGDNVWIGPNAVIITSKHVRGPSTQRAADELINTTVRIGSGTGIGANAVITAGVTIGEGCMIGAGAVILKDVPPNTVMVGSPAYVHEKLTANLP